jgi:hypothetical protein
VSCGGRSLRSFLDRRGSRTGKPALRFDELQGLEATPAPRPVTGGYASSMSFAAAAFHRQITRLGSLHERVTDWKSILRSNNAGWGRSSGA